jgi:hypothetical protein
MRKLGKLALVMMLAVGTGWAQDGAARRAGLVPTFPVRNILVSTTT